MDVAFLNVKITFQKNSVEVDAIVTIKTDGQIIIPVMPRSVVRVELKSIQPGQRLRTVTLHLPFGGAGKLLKLMSRDTE